MGPRGEWARRVGEGRLLPDRALVHQSLCRLKSAPPVISAVEYGTTSLRREAQVIRVQRIAERWVNPPGI